MPQREHRELEAIPHVAFVVDGGEHVLHGLLCKAVLDRHLAVLPSGDDAADEVALARRQLDVRWRRPQPAYLALRSNSTGCD